NKLFGNCVQSSSSSSSSSQRQIKICDFDFNIINTAAPQFQFPKNKWNVLCSSHPEAHNYAEITNLLSHI
ncbi:hypothetical protein M5D96_012616, partial [Drosophila gunungcola]